MNLNESEVTSFSPPPPLPSSAILCHPLPPVTVAFVPNPLASWVTPWPQVGGFNHQTWWTFMGFPDGFNSSFFFSCEAERCAALRFEERRQVVLQPSHRERVNPLQIRPSHDPKPWIFRWPGALRTSKAQAEENDGNFAATCAEDVGKTGVIEMTR